MRIDFNVLWVDDQPDHIAALAEPIRRHMADHGFAFNPIQRATLDEVRTVLGDGTFADDIDLILVDWELGQNVEGQHVIKAIKDHVRYKDVVFYSGRQPQDLRQLAFDEHLEGVYCASRESLVDEVLGVFDSLVKKVLDLDHSRGIVIGATCDIDEMVFQCLTHLGSTLGDADSASVLEKAKDLIAEQATRSAGNAATAAAATNIADLFALRDLFSSYHRLRVLHHALNLDTLSAYKAAVPTISAYLDKVVPHRNILGHQVLLASGKPNRVVTATDRVIDVTELREIRRAILEHRGEFRSLLAALTRPL